MKEFRQPQKQNEGLKTQVVAFSTYVCRLQGGKLGCSHVSQKVQKFTHKKTPCQNKQISNLWGEPLQRAFMFKVDMHVPHISKPACVCTHTYMYVLMHANMPTSSTA